MPPQLPDWTGKVKPVQLDMSLVQSRPTHGHGGCRLQELVLILEQRKISSVFIGANLSNAAVYSTLERASRIQPSDLVLTQISWQSNEIVGSRPARSPMREIWQSIEIFMSIQYWTHKSVTPLWKTWHQKNRDMCHDLNHDTSTSTKQQQKTLQW